MKGKQIAALDYGTNASGGGDRRAPYYDLAAGNYRCRCTGFVDVVQRFADRLGALVVSVPVREDGTKSAIVKKIENLLRNCADRLKTTCHPIRRSFFRHKAAFQKPWSPVAWRKNNGSKKDKRQSRGNGDITGFLRDFERNLLTLTESTPKRVPPRYSLPACCLPWLLSSSRDQSAYFNFGENSFVRHTPSHDADKDSTNMVVLFKIVWLVQNRNAKNLLMISVLSRYRKQWNRTVFTPTHAQLIPVPTSSMVHSNQLPWELLGI